MPLLGSVTLLGVSAKYQSEDRRSFDERGHRRRLPPPSGLPVVDFRKSFGRPLSQTFQYVRAQIEHDPSVRHKWPKAGHLPTVLRGFAVSTEQLYEGARRLLSDETIMPPAVLVRAMLEGLGNVLLLTQDPVEWLPKLRRDCYRSEARAVAYLRTSRPSDSPFQADSERRLAGFAEDLRLADEERSHPPREFEWPRPGKLLGNPDVPPLLRDDRLLVFQILYGLWYGQLSSLAHHRLAALQMAVYTEEQPDEEAFHRTRQEIVTLAVLVPFCVLSEVEAHLRLPTYQPLRVAWEKLRAFHDIPAAVFDARYRRLLRMAE